MKELDARLGAMWSGADYESLARRFAALHDELVSRLAPEAGERWLDVATGTGEVALRAARAGARVTGLDISPGLLDQARAKARSESLEIQWELGTAEALPYQHESFDVVSSNVGVIFAADKRAAAGELARVSKPGARLGLTSWKPQLELDEIYERFAAGPPPSDPELWSTEAGVRRLLGDEFELDFDEGVWRLEAESPAAAWDFYSTAIPPLAALSRQLEPDRRAALRRALVDYWGNFRTADGAVSEPREFLFVLGRRR